jgi:hypothetical protein
MHSGCVTLSVDSIGLIWVETDFGVSFFLMKMLILLFTAVSTVTLIVDMLVSVFMDGSLCDLFLINWLFFVVEETDSLLFHHFFD